MANTKGNFYDVQRNMAERQEAVAFRLMDCACEQWLNAEIRAILNSPDTKSLKSKKGDYAIGEEGRRDISVYSRGRLSHHMEVKVIYPQYSQKSVTDRLGTLNEQLAKMPVDADMTNLRRVGLVFGVWTSMNSGGGKPEAFFGDFRQALQDHFEDSPFKNPHGFRSVGMVDTEIEWAGEPVRVVMKGTFFAASHSVASV